MEFDKSKILTVATADRLTQGQMGWIENSMQELAESVRTFKPSRVLKNEGDNSFECPFISNIFPKRYFYPAPEPTYVERQAQWVKENNVKEGTKVRVTRAFTENEDGCLCWTHGDLVGMTGSVCKHGVLSYNLVVTMSDGNVRAIPYFALEVIKEPTYRPFKNAEEFKPYRDEWFKTKIDEERTARAGTVNYSDFGVVMCWYNIHGNQELGHISWDVFFQSFKREHGEPCGVKI